MVTEEARDSLQGERGHIVYPGGGGGSEGYFKGERRRVIDLSFGRLALLSGNGDWL